MKIRIATLVGGMQFPYGTLTPENKEFVQNAVGQEFEAVLSGMNYYTLANGMMVHVYNAVEVPAKSYLVDYERQLPGWDEFDKVEFGDIVVKAYSVGEALAVANDKLGKYCVATSAKEMA